MNENNIETIINTNTYNRKYLFLMNILRISAMRWTDQQHIFTLSKSLLEFYVFASWWLMLWGDCCFFR